MNANELTFGIEIETVAPESAIRIEGLRIGYHHYGIQVPYLPTGWRAETDASIEAYGIWRACEIVSPILRGEEGIHQVIEVVRTLEAKYHRINSSCGVHIHVGWDRNWSSKALARLISIVAYLEKALYAITGTKNRERSPYCDGVRKYGNDKAAKPVLDCDRYHLLNLHNLAHGVKDTVEFRAFSGSLNSTKIVGWIQVCLGLVERALVSKRKPNWNPRPSTSTQKKTGPGQYETERLLSYLAWGKSYARIHGGKQYGWVSDTIPQDQIKSEFRRLARKYDAQP